MHPGPVHHNWHLHLKTTQPQQQPAPGRLGGENRLYLQSSEERTELYWAGGGRGAVLRSSSAVAVTSGCAQPLLPTSSPTVKLFKILRQKRHIYKRRTQNMSSSLHQPLSVEDACFFYYCKPINRSNKKVGALRSNLWFRKVMMEDGR